MHVQQVSVFLENKAGRLAEVTGILSEAGVNLRALALADTSDFGVLRLIVDDHQKAETALKTAGFTVSKTDVVAVAVDDRPGGLHHILTLLNRNGINIEYMYAFVQPNGDNAVIIFRFDRIAAAVDILAGAGIAPIAGDRLYAM